jgi:plastocyanin
MSQTTVFYVLGITLVLCAVGVAIIGLRNRDFPSPAMLRGGIALFVTLVAATATFALLQSRQAQTDRREKQAAEKLGGSATQTTAATPSKVSGPGGTLKLAANRTALAFDTTKLQSKPGKVTIDFANPAALQHDVVIQKGSTDLAKSPLIASGNTSVSAELAPGTYTFYCNVPGHRDAGMQGTLTVK